MEARMTLTTLDRRTALILIDLQKGVLTNHGAHPVPEILKNATALANAFRSRGLLVVLVNVAGTAPGRTEQALTHGPRPTDWSELVSELDPQPQDYLVTKRTWGAFTSSDLQTYLDRTGVTQVVIGGVSTSIGVESTARHAYELGYHVTLAVDAMTDRSAKAHRNSIEHIFPRLGETGTTADITALLSRTATPSVQR
jgi:nicotinamidase-related amidase